MGRSSKRRRFHYFVPPESTTTDELSYAPRSEREDDEYGDPETHIPFYPLPDNASFDPTFATALRSAKRGKYLNSMQVD
jgi:hypothetical protein